MVALQMSSIGKYLGLSFAFSVRKLEQTIEIGLPCPAKTINLRKAPVDTRPRCLADRACRQNRTNIAFIKVIVK